MNQNMSAYPTNNSTGRQVMGVQEHECCHLCHVVHEFGNLYRCLNSGQLHVCDANCNQRLYNDRYSTICRVSKKLLPPFDTDMCDAPRKRTAEPDVQEGPWKRKQAGHQPVFA